MSETSHVVVTATLKDHVLLWRDAYEALTTHLRECEEDSGYAEGKCWAEARDLLANAVVKPPNECFG